MNKNHVLLPSLIAAAVAANLAQAQTPAGDQEGSLQEVVVTGSRIIQTGVNAQSPISIINRDAIDKTGLASVGDLLQQAVSSGKALNAKFNSSGNFGYPADGGGIGAGSAQVDLRNLSSKRVLVLVDGIRWVNESSASGVSGAADLNTIPLSIIDRIEVLEDGASAIYGSDAIAGVVNIITRKDFEGVELNAYRGEFEIGGATTDASITIGGGGEKFHGMFVASFYEQKGISSGKWEQSRWPQPNAGLAAGSSGIPQGRFTFCDPSRAAGAAGFCGDPDLWYDVTLDNGALPTGWNPADPGGGNFHDFSGADRFNFAPYNLLLTPSERKALFASVEYAASDSVTVYAKGLFNNRQSTNQAAPEPIFVGPFAGSGGLADTISVSALNPYNPFGIDLDANSNLGWVTRRPVEVGPRIFTQDVDTWYANVGVKGEFGGGQRRYHWDVNAVTSENNADQVFVNGYNVAKMALALGDPAICALVPGCVPLDLFGGQARPFTPEMINWIRTTQIDQSSQKLTLFAANLTGTLFEIGDRPAGFAVGAEHRKYQGEFLPDPLRQTGESQDSFASPVNSSYDVDELYAEFNFPLLATFDASAAIRWSDYSTFGSETTGKVGMRWKPVDAIAVRGTYSKGFRAPNLGELYGLTQFAATLVDPCGPTGVVVVDASDGLDTTPLETACRAQGVPNGFEQANTQITTFTGGNADLDPEKSDSWTLGLVHDAAWADAFSQRLTFELTYYSHEIEKGIQARDIQALINACLAAGGTDATLCSPFTRGASGNLNPPNNFLDNLGSIETDGVDLKIDWRGNEMSWGTLSAGLQATRTNKYEATDTDGIISQRAVGIEVSDSAIPKLQANLQLGWEKGDWGVNWSARYIDSVREYCGNAVISDVPGCDAGQTFHTLDSAVYNDVQVAWNRAFGMDKFRLSLGVNNVFGEDPPICYSCSLNGYDAGTYDLPGTFWALTARYGF